MDSRRSYLGIVFCFLIIGSISEAETLVVSSASDRGPGSLRNAIILADSNGEADVIEFQDDMTIVLDSPFPTITSEIRILGRGWERTVIDGGASRIGGRGVALFDISTGGALELDGVMLQNADSSWEDGSTVWNRGSFEFRNSRAERNDARYGGIFATTDGGDSRFFQSTISENNCEAGPDSFEGVILLKSGAVLIEACLIADNLCSEPGIGVAAVVNLSGVLDIKESLLEGNRGDLGGAVSTGGTTRIVNSTLSGNRAESGSAIYHMAGELAIGFSTIAGNRTTTGGAIHSSGSVRPIIQMNIIAGNIGPNCGGGGVKSRWFNIEDSNDCRLDGNGDQIHTNPMIGPLAANGGLTDTYSLLQGSPAIDGGDPNECRWDWDGHPASPDDPVDWDQRGAFRPTDGDANGTAICDVGAFENPAAAMQPFFVDGFESGSAFAWSAVVNAN